MGNPADLVAIGKIVKPFGVRGDVRVRSLSDVPQRFPSLLGKARVTLVAPSGEALETIVSRVRADGHTGEFYILGFEGISTPEAAATFRGGFIKIPSALSPPLPADTYYAYQLTGLTVRSEEGRELGIVEDVVEAGGDTHVLVLRQGPQERLLPATKDVVVQVDAARRVMTVRLIDGILDEGETQ